MALALQVVSSHHLGALDIEKLSLFKSFLSNASCHMPQPKPRHSSGRIVRAFSAGWLFFEFDFGPFEQPIAHQFAR